MTLKKVWSELSTIDKVVLALAIISLVALVFTNEIVNLTFTKTETYYVDVENPILPIIVAMQLEEGDRVKLVIETNGTIRYSLKGYYIRPNPGSEFNPIRTRFILVDNNIKVEDTYTRIFNARIVGTYAVEITSVDAEEDAETVEVSVTMQPVERPNWVFRIRVVALVVLAIALLYFFGRFYEEPMTRYK